jgi:hypothetical protein
MRLRGKMHYRVGPIFPKQTGYLLNVTDINLFEMIPGMSSNLVQGLEISCIGQFINIDNSVA